MANYINEILMRLINLNNFRNDFLRILPEEYHAAAKLLFFNKLNITSEEKKLGKEIESFRHNILKLHNEKEIMSYWSPRSKAYQNEKLSGHLKPGPYKASKIEDTMKTGTNIFKGILLRRIIEGAGVSRILELGTNTGFSGCYFLSVKNTELVTVEGSDALCTIADKNLKRISGNYTIMNCLFDEAIDQLLEKNEQFDCVFLDGQHERESTIHYTKRLDRLMKDGAIFIYDDIYWSEDMNQAWKELCYNFHFTHGIDLFLVGVLKKMSKSKNAFIYDLGDYLPRPKIIRKGW